MSSGGLVLKPMEKTLFLSSLATCIYSAPVFSCCKCKAVSCSSGTYFVRFKVKPCSCSPGFGKLLRSVTEAYVRRSGDCLEYDHLRRARLGGLRPHLDGDEEGMRSMFAVSSADVTRTRQPNRWWKATVPQSCSRQMRLKIEKASVLAFGSSGFWWTCRRHRKPAVRGHGHLSHHQSVRTSTLIYFPRKRAHDTLGTVV